jgi:thiamine-monophosphate kinase
MKKCWSELALIEMLAERVASISADGLIKGIGDDCAVFANRDNRQWLATTDILVDKVHFDLDWHPPHLLGRKAIAVNISDIAAMGGTPHYALVSMVIPENLEHGFLAELADGSAEILAEHNCAMIGGDTSRGPVLTLNIVLLGSCAAGRAVLRSGATPGDHVFVSGSLGSAAAGLEISRRRSALSEFSERELQPFVEKHLNPVPQVRLGQLLGETAGVSAMQDLSDGLATDLAHICLNSNVGAEIQADLLPGNRLIESICKQLNLDPIALKVSGGDDYELIFTVKPDKSDALMNQIAETGEEKVYRIGKIVTGSGVKLVKNGALSDISFQGYQHGAELP